MCGILLGMQKGIDYTGITVSFYCHDGAGNYIFHKRSDKCRDEHGRWDCGGGGVKFNESLQDAVRREVQEEFATEPLEIEFMGWDEVFRTHGGKPTHWLAFRYRVRLDREKVVNNEPEKHTELIWTTLDMLPEPLHSQVPHELEKYREYLQ